MESVLTQAREHVVEKTASVMKYVASQFDFSEATQVGDVHEKSIVQQSAAGFVEELVWALRQSKTYAVDQFESSVRQLRNSYKRFFGLQSFRQAVKLHARVWAIHESRRLDFEDESELYGLVEYLLNELMSPLELEGGVPLFDERNVREELLRSIYRRLPQFVGLSDYLNEDTDVTLSKVLSSPLVTPTWYDEQEVDAWLDDDMALRLYKAITDRCPRLQRTHQIEATDGLLTSVLITEYTGQTIANAPFRCLVATTTHRGEEGNDFYIVLHSKFFNGHGMLVGDPGDSVGGGILYEVYRAYAAAIMEETGDIVNIDKMVDELDEVEDDFWD